ncbi:MAG: hypothetical protein QM296_05995 [Bacillota bacterium]|nr:hypothetical protein [Bacillota bacterium]
MKRIGSILLIAALVLSLAACSKGGQKEFTTNLPPETGELGEDIRIDASNHIQIKKAEVVRDGEREILLITYDWYFEGGKARAGFEQYVITAKQGGVALKGDLSQVESIKKLVTQINVDEKLEDIQQGFVLRDQEPVTLSLMGNESWIFKEGKPVHAYPVTVEVPVAP